MSKLDSYISKLLSDDDALKEFLVDPIKAAEDDNGLTKGQRSVLRRVVAGLSNNATNGYSIVRHLDSYRRSIRLLQNVLHLERGAAVNSHAQAQAQVSDAKAAVVYTYTIVTYYNGDPSNPQGDIDKPSQQYAYSITHTVSTQEEGLTLDKLMDKAGIIYDSKNYGTSDNPVNAVTSIQCDYKDYEAAPQDVTERVPFWYFSVNGKAITDTGYGTTGYEENDPANVGGPGAGETFDSYVPPSGSTIYWQIIAPDETYGYGSCVTATKENTF